MEIVRPIVQECFIPAQYTSSPEIIKNCLQEVLSEGMMYAQVSAPAYNEDMTKKQRENIIKMHIEQFTTKYYESDRRWHSFLPDDTHPQGRKPIAKRKWEDLESVILAYYEEQEQSNKRKKITLRTLYPEWFAYKWQDTNNFGYMNHIDGEWKRYYENDPIVDRPVVEFTTLELKNWARNKIITGKLNKKQYYNMAIIIRQSLEYLVELGELPCNHFAEHPNRTAALAVLINFSLGLRVGELVALKWRDLKDSYLHIRRMEQKQYEQLENGKWKKHLEVVEHTKSDAGYRILYVVSSAMELFDKVKEANLRNGYSCEAEDYIFMYRKHRITANSIDSHYERYCKQIGISKKGNLKARKTALTKVADNPNINLTDAMEFAGHRDVKTFINHYCFSRYSDEQKRQELEKTLKV
ncbi:MAG: tyrosine-type recombinase/integrase [Lachnospiraceae bacterium]|nr:tyrosine-type recombinase/integrase [Lachnospiraceae bacterium]